jgi:hypothetical protein
MKFICGHCGEVDHVLMDGYGVGERLLEGVMFKITIKKEKFQETLKAHVQDQDKSYFTDNHISIKKWEKEMTVDAKDSYEEDACCFMICPKCEQDQVIEIKEA